MPNIEQKVRPNNSQSDSISRPAGVLSECRVMQELGTGASPNEEFEGLATIRPGGFVNTERFSASTPLRL
jgi:hypothetical protein